MPTFPLMGFCRHRLGIDGAGVTTLAAAHGCPLRCRMCLNPQCLSPETQFRQVTPEALWEMARVDDLYFRATGGGVVFGGGEPLLHAEFIRAFREICGDGWRILAETCMNVPEEKVRTAAACVDEFMVDIKDMNPEIYARYTGGDNAQTLQNLRLLLDVAGAGRVVVRVPHIPGFNAPEDVRHSVDALKRLGATRLDVFTYREKPALSP